MMTYTPDMVRAQVLYDSILRNPLATVTYDGTVVDGFDPLNAYDWRDFTTFIPEAGAHLIVESAGAMVADTIVVWWASSGSNSITLEVWDGANWVSPLVITQGGTAEQKWTDISRPPSTKWRMTFSGINPIRQISLGLKLTFPIGQWQGIAPPSMYSGVVVGNVIAENGSFLGRNIRRLEKKGNLELTLLLPDWVRSYWTPFAMHAARYPFWYRWHPVAYPTEVALAAAENIVAPTNASPAPRMNASMALRLLTA